MTLPSLNNWRKTGDALHQAAQVVGAIRVACADPLPNDWHFSLDLTEAGLSTGALLAGGALHLDLSSLEIRFARGGKDLFALNLTDHSQASLMRRALGHFADIGCDIEPSMRHIQGESDFEIDPRQAADYWQVLTAVYSVLSSFRGTLRGCATPLVLWPHHFDLGFISFPRGGGNEQSDPQIAFGFAPFSPGLDRPYIYAYAWSGPTGYIQVPLDAPTQANRRRIHRSLCRLRPPPNFARHRHCNPTHAARLSSPCRSQAAEIDICIAFAEFWLRLFVRSCVNRCRVTSVKSAEPRPGIPIPQAPEGAKKAR